ncbi:MOSC domain-containing protein [Pelagibius sp. CAU 1746]|uniref:MOSC domain-containing protein n=1 Tax=Pelagibius sp. CAU 1746 TaxID=3140370 RepID=UPI00325AE9EC
MATTVQQICRYPVKGLNGESLAGTSLLPGGGLPEDRRYVIAYGRGTGAKPGFFELTEEERLAQLRIAYDPAGPTLTVSRQGRQVVTANPSDPTGQVLLNQFFAGFLAGSRRGTPSFRDMAGADQAAARPRPVSILNLASLRDFERVARQPVDPRRFRANILIDGLPAWSEFAWLNREIRIGTVRLKIIERIERCAATNVNPETAERDMNVPLTLRKGFGHMDMGVYAEIVDGGEIKTGDPVSEV